MNMKPIIFSAESVQAILDRRKTMTRRVMVPQPTKCRGFNLANPCGGEDWRCNSISGTVGCKKCSRMYSYSYEGQDSTRLLRSRYVCGDILWVREAWHHNNFGVFYRADWPNGNCPDMDFDDKWRSPMFMPRAAARIFLRVTDVQVQRVHEITGQDILAEGVDNGRSNPAMGERWENMQRIAFSELWDSINGHRGPKGDRERYSWARNPWVLAYRFKRIGREEAERSADMSTKALSKYRQFMEWDAIATEQQFQPSWVEDVGLAVGVYLGECVSLRITPTFDGFFRHLEKFAPKRDLEDGHG